MMPINKNLKIDLIKAILKLSRLIQISEVFKVLVTDKQKRSEAPKVLNVDLKQF